MKLPLIKEIIGYIEEMSQEQDVSKDLLRTKIQHLVASHRFLESKVEEMQKTIQDIHDKLKNCVSHEMVETINYCYTKAFYALKGFETK